MTTKNNRLHNSPWIYVRLKKLVNYILSAFALSLRTYKEAGIVNFLKLIIMPITRDWDRVRIIVPLISLLVFSLWLMYCELKIPN